MSSCLVPNILEAPSNDGALVTKAMIAICTYEESQNITGMLTQLRAAFPDATLLVVDDNSPDGTAKLVETFRSGDPNVRLIVRQNERGLGSAIVAAMQESIDGGYDFFLNLDGDFSHAPDQLPQLLRRATASPKVDVVIGSRYVEGGKIVGWPLRRRLMSKMVNRFAVSCLRLPVKDCSGSMRCYRTVALDAIGLDSLQCTGYAVLEEVLVKLHRNGSEMTEVPITFTERQLGASKLTLAEAFRSIRFMVRLAISLRR